MKAEKYFLILAAIIGILCCHVLSEEELISESIPLGLGQPNPALTEIKLLRVVIISNNAEAGKYGLDTMVLQNKIEDRLKKAGIRVFVPEKGIVYKLPLLSRLDVYLEVVDIADSNQCVFRVQTLLSQHVRLKEQTVNIRADVWKTKPIMQKVSTEGMPAVVTNAILGQVGNFIHAYLAANPPNKRPSDANDISIIPKEQFKPVAESIPAEYKYIASKNSKVFHKLDCIWVKRIKPENLVNYSSRDEAINAGKKPCKQCNP